MNNFTRYNWCIAVLMSSVLMSACKKDTGIYPGDVSQNPEMIFNVLDFGATGDGTTLDSPSVNSAIDSCASVGGGTVLFPAGDYLCNSIHLKSNVHLYLDEGATILANRDIDPPEPSAYTQYQDFGHSHFHDALIWGENLHNIKITGKGKIDGNDALTTSLSSEDKTLIGDKAIALKLCSNIEIGGIDEDHKMILTQFGHFAALITGCDTVEIHHVYVPEDDHQRDIFNIMACNDATVSDIYSEFSMDDVVKLGSDYSLGFKRPSSNITIKNITGYTWCNVFQIGSETVAPISNVNVSDITVLGAGKAGLSITCNDGSVIDGVTITNATMKGTTTPIFINLTNRGRCPNPSMGKIMNVTINNVTAVDCEGYRGEYTSTISGLKTTASTTYIENVTIENVQITAKGGHSINDSNKNPVEYSNGKYNTGDIGIRPAYGWYIRHIQNLKLINCNMDFDANDDRYAMVIDDANTVELDQVAMQKGEKNDYRLYLRNSVSGFNMHDCQDLPLVQEDVTNTKY